jgi:hypothetical protein
MGRIRWGLRRSKIKVDGDGVIRNVDLGGTAVEVSNGM